MTATISLELEQVSTAILGAKFPEDLFGQLDGEKMLTRLYRRMAKVCHSDKYQRQDEKDVAGEAFKKLDQFRDTAAQKLKDGTYGDRKAGVQAAPALITVQSRKAVYALSTQIAKGDLCDVYEGQFDDSGTTVDVIVKITRKPSNNDLSLNEAKIIRQLMDGHGEDVKRRFPPLIDSFAIRDTANAKRVVNVFTKYPDCVTGDDVLSKFPGALDPRHAVWMANRLWATLGVAHEAGIVHGAIVPSHMLIFPENHGVILLDWSYASQGELIKAICPRYRAFYPPEVLKKQKPTPATDVYLVAMTISALLGATPSNGMTYARNVPMPIQAFLRSCLIAQHARLQNGWTAFDEFKEVSKQVYGPSRFVPFHVS